MAPPLVPPIIIIEDHRLQSPDLLSLFALLAGLLVGVLITHVLYRRRLEESVAARTRDLEVQYQQSQSDFALRESDLQHQLRQYEEQARERREQLLQLEQKRDSLQSSLSDAQQQLAAAREKAQYQSDLQQQLRERDSQLASARSEATELQTRLGQERKSYEQQLKLLQDAKVQLTGEFENLANKIFDSKQQQFSNNSKSLLETTIDPLKTQLSEFRRKVEDVYEKENAERNRLSGQVVELQKQAQKIGEDAVNLAQALKGNTKSQGNWGEVVLERLLEQSGLQKGREYDTQVSYSGADGSRRMPDVIVHLPENKDIVIDAKVSLVDYEKFCNSEDAQERQTYLQQHVNSLRSHIKGLSVKEYEKLEGVKSLDFVFIFVPIEAAFMLALQHEPNLYSEAYDKHIILASPTTLLAILRTVENIWRYEKQNKNAERIARDAGSLHDQFVLLLESLDGIGAHLGKTQEAFDKAHKRLYSGRGNLVKRVDDIRRLGAKTKKSIARELVEDAADEHERLLEDQSEVHLELDDS
ncbi:DNA recombination protein RmuC [Marinimicrobium sp. ABcell2]|uniref:DNA recombination protein RmuC n=1 Tax=Marinimicrobium sp. ABcell2 TaxID=3069751 RepID=UPI0027B1172A|nr:DNA recombination protein RmuC [Marinimicrobium sp. ABcell2]MDQ2078020.1 DNA recombination protein RmuC [Marinimicrobium sp. ABcell2]